MDIQVIPIDSLVVTPEFQPRRKLNPDAIIDYSDAYERGEELPALEATQTDDALILTDGFHRYTALRRLKRTEARIAVTVGTEADAHFAAAGSNRKNGVHRDREDTDAAIKQALLGIAAMAEDKFERTYGRGRMYAGSGPRIGGWTALDIARIVGLSDGGPSRYQIKEIAVKNRDLQERSYEYRVVKARREREAEETEAARKASGASAPTDMATYRAPPADASEDATTAPADEERTDGAESASERDDERTEEETPPETPDTPEQNAIAEEVFRIQMRKGLNKLTGQANTPMLTVERMIRQYGEPTLRRYARGSEMAARWQDSIDCARRFADFAETFLTHEPKEVHRVL